MRLMPSKHQLTEKDKINQRQLGVQCSNYVYFEPLYAVCLSILAQFYRVRVMTNIKTQTDEKNDCRYTDCTYFLRISSAAYKAKFRFYSIVSEDVVYEQL